MAGSVRRFSISSSPPGSHPASQPPGLPQVLSQLAGSCSDRVDRFLDWEPWGLGLVASPCGRARQSEGQMDDSPDPPRSRNGLGFRRLGGRERQPFEGAGNGFERGGKGWVPKAVEWEVVKTAFQQVGKRGLPGLFVKCDVVRKEWRQRPFNKRTALKAAEREFGKLPFRRVGRQRPPDLEGKGSQRFSKKQAVQV
ncbi:hypothetical protein GGTG_13302 [Gaeumannomyces tritici R3-111a-1]|uniref:Uncharacterized protein n=1 Tax=Gaeumannomyces tritici (strain R3-111a-1) TaxID=644352 RepID=J3PIH4_GAET3|nr:hypothetical protein GGTG_13302 [Gaeumannomyces tritici R3-111a-1]EJT69193.1 hypothetical protein GGTG_13302 [Gaeumannomyces tritici R3-111a-1]